MSSLWEALWEQQLYVIWIRCFIQMYPRLHWHGTDKEIYFSLVLISLKFSWKPPEHIQRLAFPEQSRTIISKCHKFLLVLCFHWIIITEDKSSIQCCHDMDQSCAMRDTDWWYTLHMLVRENSLHYNFATGITKIGLHCVTHVSCASVISFTKLKFPTS